MNTAQLARYPNLPGARGTETSRQAARAIAPRAKPLREEILAWLARGPLTTFELADRLAPTPYCTVQPRLSELKASGQVEACPERGRGPSGWSTTRWRLATGPRPPGPTAANTPDPDRRLRYQTRLLSKMREARSQRIVRLLASEPLTAEETAVRLKQKRETVGPVVSALRQSRIVQPSGLHGVTRYGRKAVRWTLHPGPYPPDTPPELLAVLREVLQAKFTHTTTPPALALRE